MVAVGEGGWCLQLSGGGALGVAVVEDLVEDLGHAPASRFQRRERDPKGQQPPTCCLNYSINRMGTVAWLARKATG